MLPYGVRTRTVSPHRNGFGPSGNIAHGQKIDTRCSRVRQSLVSHLGFDPEGGSCRRGGTLAGRLLFELIRNFDQGDYGTDAQALENKQDFVVFYEFTCLFDPFGRVIGIVIGDELDLAAVDATLGIDLVEIGSLLKIPLI
jgi:hypothetical protein